MSKGPSEIAARLRIDLGPGRSIGPGKVALLERIAACGSLSQAARELGMSYRRAWLLLDDINRSFTEPASTSSIGGAGGGGAQLTEFGRRLVRSFREVEEGASEMAGLRFAWVAGSLRTDPSGEATGSGATEGGARVVRRLRSGIRARAAKRS
jgi:molybdate transport system regulatory protein